MMNDDFEEKRKLDDNRMTNVIIVMLFFFIFLFLFLWACTGAGIFE